MQLIYIALLVITCGSIRAVADQTADTIYTGGNIITINDMAPTAEALAVKDGKILAVGTNHEVFTTKGDTTRVVDLAGKTLLPGFIDAHSHLFEMATIAGAANLRPAPDGKGNNIAAIQDILRTWAEDHKNTVAKLGLIIGFGCDEGQIKEGRLPNRDDLDAVSTSVPVIAIHPSGHMGMLNSKALELVGYTAATQDPPGGVIRRRSTSTEPDGVVEEMAFFQIIHKLLGKFDSEANRTVLKNGIELYVRAGFTTAHEGRATVIAVQTAAAAAAAGDLKIDIVAYPDIETAANVVKPPLLAHEYKNHFRIAGVKINLDGSPQGKTAWLTKPYFIPPVGQSASYTGYPAMTDAKATSFVATAYANDWQILAHCNGDAAADQFIQAIRVNAAKYGGADRRPVMIHAQTVREDQLDAMQQLGIVPSFFAMHTYYWGDWHRDSVFGPERAARISPAVSALKRGMVVTQHHDAPVTLPSAVMILHTQVNRITRSGKILGPEQRVSVMEALKSITINAAWQYFEEKTKGSLEPGKLADLVILDANPLTVEPLVLKDINVLETIKEGTTVFIRK